MCRKKIYITCFGLLACLVMTYKAVADPSLAGWWKFDGTAGIIAADSSPNGNDGTLINGPVWISGKIKGAVEMDGADDYIELPIGSTISMLTECTIATWVNFYNSGGAWQRVFDFGNNTTVYMFLTPAVNTNESLRFAITTAGNGVEDVVDAGGMLATGWHHIAVTVSARTTTIIMYLDGQEVGRNIHAVNNVSSMGVTTNNWIGRSHGAGDAYFQGAIDDFFIFSRVLSQPEIQDLMVDYSREIASEPSPKDEETDVYRDGVLSWTAGDKASQHNVYLGTNFDDVNNANTSSPLLIGPGVSSATLDPGRLEFNQQYFWRVDEVNAPPDNTVFKGKVWSFTVEPFAYAIPAANIIPTASGSEPGQGPEKTIDGSGLDENDLHSINAADMWLSSPGDPGSAWIQYEFDKPYKLHEMLIWNYNGDTILSFYGIKEVTIEYSADGVTWTQANISELTQAPGVAGYAANTTVPFDGAEVKYVKVTANNNFMGGVGIFNKYGISEVRFMYIPVSARKPNPESRATEVAIDIALTWRPGREADQHIVYLSTDQQAVIDGTAPATIVDQRVDGPLSLDLGSMYYWRVDEVNNLEAVQTWRGDVWSFTTQDYLVVDDFESYNNIPEGQGGSNLVYITWEDGYANPAANGSTMGYVSGASTETDIVYGGNQSAPMFYDNTSASLSEVTVDPGKLPIGRNWSKGSPQTLVLWIYGDLGNTGNGQLYVKVGNSKFPYDSDITRPWWNPIIIDLIGVNLNNVSSLTIGLERTGGAGGSGMILLDEIILYGVALQPPEEIWIEAEAADSIEVPMMIYNDPNASGGQYIMKNPDAATSTSSPPADGLVTYQFTVAGGVYKITGRVITNGNNDSFWLRIPDVPMNVAGDPSNPGWIEWNGLTQEVVWGWEDVFSSNNDNVTVEFTLEAGTYTLEIRYREDESQLDALVITRID
jgi:hypothetical protein